jgi:tetratricopeptide (TPR) repeat protein
MPGHIYAQSDRTDDAIEAFTQAASNELKWLDTDVLYSNLHHAHNVHFLVHALNLEGRYQDSMERARHLMSFKETPRDRTGSNQRTPYRQGYYALVKTLVRFERWDLILDATTIPQYDKPEQRAWKSWAAGLAYAAKDRIDDARAQQADLKTHLKSITASRGALAVAEIELDAQIAARASDREEGYARFRKAAAMEAALLYTEPPTYPRPVAEGLALTALALGDYDVAAEGYREALAREPGSGRAYFGLAAALQGRRDAAGAREMLSKARLAWSKADADLPQMRRLATAPASGR